MGLEKTATNVGDGSRWKTQLQGNRSVALVAALQINSLSDSTTFSDLVLARPTRPRGVMPTRCVSESSLGLMRSVRVVDDGLLGFHE